MKNPYFFLLEFLLKVFTVVRYIWITFARKNILKTSLFLVKKGKKVKIPHFGSKYSQGELNLLNSIIMKFFVLNSINLINSFIEFLNSIIFLHKNQYFLIFLEFGISCFLKVFDQIMILASRKSLGASRLLRASRRFHGSSRRSLGASRGSLGT